MARLSLSRVYLQKFDFLVFRVSLLAMSQSDIFPNSAFTVSSMTLRFGWEKKGWYHRQTNGNSEPFMLGGGMLFM